MKNLIQITIVYFLLAFCVPAYSSSPRQSVKTSTMADVFLSKSEYKTEKKKKTGFFKRTLLKRVLKKTQKKIKKGIASSDGKDVALLAHITLIGWLIALMMHKENPTSLGSYHLGQVLGLFLMLVGGSLLTLIPVIGWIIGLVVVLGGLINWVSGLIHAANAQEKPMPIFGNKFDEWFGDTF